MVKRWKEEGQRVEEKWDTRVGCCGGVYGERSLEQVPAALSGFDKTPKHQSDSKTGL